MRKLTPPFGSAVRAVLEEHGISQRMAAIRTEIDRTTMGEMVQGVPPRMELVIRFARGFGLDEAEWLRLAGYEPPASPFDPDGYFMGEVRQLVGRGYRIIVDSQEDPLSWSTREEVEAALARVRKRAGCACLSE